MGISFHMLFLWNDEAFLLQKARDVSQVLEEPWLE